MYSGAKPFISRAGNRADAWLAQFDPSGNDMTRHAPRVQQGTQTDAPFQNLDPNWGQGTIEPWEFPETRLPRFTPDGFLIPRVNKS